MDTLRAMRVFVRLVELKSLAKAAESLEMEKGTASKLLQQLESHLKIPLVERHARRLIVTDEGRGYYQDARQILIEVEGAESRVRGDNSQARGRLRVEMPTALGHGVLGPLIPGYLAAHPGLNIELMISDRALDIVEHGIDVALRVGSPPELDSAARLLGNYTSIVCAAPSYRSPRGLSVAQTGTALLSHPHELAGERCLIALHPSEGWHHRWELTQTSSGAHEVVDVDGPLSVSNQPLLIEMALCGAGIINVPEALVAHHITEGRLVRLLPDWGKPGAPLYAIYSPIRPLPRRIASFLDWLSMWARQADDKGTLGHLDPTALTGGLPACPALEQTASGPREDRPVVEEANAAPRTVAPNVAPLFPAPALDRTTGRRSTVTAPPAPPRGRRNTAP